MFKVQCVKIAIVSICLVTMACGGNKTTASDADADSTAADSAAVADSTELAAADEWVPSAADELFDDFIFNFAANKKLQLKRVKFPVAVVRGQKTDSIPKSKWTMEYFFMRQGYYTLLFDSEKQMEQMKNTGINHAIVEKIQLRKNVILQYLFHRERGLWMLETIKELPIQQSHNASFLTFYQKFATDSAFQERSLNSTVQFEGPDPDDDFSRMEGIITPDTWAAFAPKLPMKQLYNIIYGEPVRESNHKIFMLRGIANGLELEMTFKRVGNTWKLMKLTT